MKTKLFALGLLAAFFTLPACDNDPEGQNGNGNADGGAGNSVGMIISQYKVPTSEAEAKTLG